MNVDAAEASRALDDIAYASGRTTRLQGYRESAPHFMLWGMVWMIGNGSMDLAPHLATWIWPALIAVALVVTIVLSFRQARAIEGEDRRETAARGRMGTQIMLMIFLVFALVLAAAVVFWPVEYRQMNAFISLCAGFAYVGAGILAGWRWVMIGAVVIGAVLAGYLLLEDYYYLWMAVAGGGSLFVAGLLIRRA